MNIPSNTTPIRFLCLNVDNNFIAYLLAAAEPINLSLDICKSIDDARQKILTTSYDAFIIDLSSSNAQAFDLVNELKTKATKKSPIAIVSETLRDEERIRSMKEKGVIDYVLKKPISPQQVDTLLNELTQPKTPAPAEAPSPGSKLQELKRNYEKTIFDKLELLTRLVKAVQAYPEQPQLEELKGAVHKIGGSAGSYGYENVSTLCKELDKQISEKLISIKSINAKWLNSLDEFLTKVKTAFQRTSQTGPQSFIVSSFIPRPSIYVIDYDIKFLELLERVKEQFPIELFVESDPRKAIDRLKAADFNPKALVVSQNFPNTSLTAYDIIQQQSKKENSSTSVFSLILDHDDLETRMDAMKKGVNYVFHRPISAYVLLRSMKDALDIKALQNFRVLVLDDDIDFCNFVSIMLSEAGFNVKSIQDSSDLLSTLDDFRPHILLLDLVLPKYDGLNLLKTLRQDIAYNQLIIVIVTSSEETATRLSAYSSKADDILYKPLDKAILQNRILNLIERHATLGQHTDSQDQTGFVKVRSLTAKLHDCLVKPGRHNQYLALFEIDHFADWMAQRGYATANSLMVTIGNQLQWESNKEMTSFSYNSSKFAVIFDGPTLKSIETKMYNFLTNQAERDPQLNISFNCCIIPISQTYGTAQDLLQAAEQGIYEARQKEPSRVKLITLLPKEEKSSQKEVVLIDPDEELLRILKISFEAHGLKVQTFIDGESALNVLLANDEDQIPALIIAERKLPDMDGIELFNKLKARFREPVPLYFLTIFSSDKDVSDGLKQGALEYIGKPFNLSILIQKALKTIQEGAPR